MSAQDRVDSTLLLLVVSVLLFCVPLVDMWQDVYVGGKTPLSTVLENSVVLLLSGAFVRLSVWLRRSDWEPEYTRLVARWSILGTGCVALAYAWVLGFQVFAQNQLKPYVIAADGIIIAGLVLFVAGIYNARSERESAARTAESQRFSALFDNTSDAMVAVESGDGDPVITEVNEPFEQAFGTENASFVGRQITETIPERIIVAPDDERTPANDPETRLRTLADDPDSQVEFRLSTNDGDRDYLVGYIPVGTEPTDYGGTDGFFIFTDITPQKQRERQFETLSEGSMGLLDARSVEGVAAAVRTLVVDLFEDVVVGMWRYDRESESFQALMITAAGSTADLEELTGVPTAPDEHPSDDSDGEREFDGRPPGIDTETLEQTVSDRGVPVRDTVERTLVGAHKLTISRAGPALSTTDRYLIDLLVANTRAAVRGVEHEEELTRRNDQLEFVNSLLRHDIQNSMTVIRARGQALSESCDGQDAAYAETIVDQSDDVIDLVDRFRALLDALTDMSGENTHPVDLSTVLEDRVGTARTTYPDLTVAADIPDGIDVVANDVLGNVFGNVLDNAVEHNDTDDPTVEVSVVEREETVAVRFADDGPGIPDDTKEAVFRRGNRGLKESDIGSGFGLFFLDTMMDQYGGEVTVTDNEPRGAVFTLVFRRPE